MKRTRRTVRVIKYPVNGIYVDVSVTAMIGAGRPHQVIRTVVHGRYKLVERLSGEALDDGVIPPLHNKVFIDPSDFSYHFLKRVR